MSRDDSWQRSRSVVDEATGCWIWTGAGKGNGYGNVREGKSNITAHRKSFEIANGAIPFGMDVCHKCDRRSCINPDHLFLGTRKQNMADAKFKGRLSRGYRHSISICGEKSSSAKLSASDVVSVRKLSAAGVSTKKLATDYGVSPSNIRRILRLDTWKEIDKCVA